MVVGHIVLNADKVSVAWNHIQTRKSYPIRRKRSAGLESPYIFIFNIKVYETNDNYLKQYNKEGVVLWN